jgi:hypothetical protein
MIEYKVGDWVRGSDELREVASVVWSATRTLSGIDSVVYIGYRRVNAVDGLVEPAPGMPSLGNGALVLSDPHERVLVHPIYATHVPANVQAYLEKKFAHIDVATIGRVDPTSVPMEHHKIELPFHAGDLVTLDPACTRPSKDPLVNATWPQAIRVITKYPDGSAKNSIYDGPAVTFHGIGGEWSAKRFKLASEADTRKSIVAEVKTELTWLNGRPISAKTTGSPATPGKEPKPANERQCGACQAVVHQQAPIKQGKGLLSATDVVFCETCAAKYTESYNAVTRAEREHQIAEAKAELDRPMTPRYNPGAILTGDLCNTPSTPTIRVRIFAGGGNSPRGRR